MQINVLANFVLYSQNYFLICYLIKGACFHSLSYPSSHPYAHSQLFYIMLHTEGPGTRGHVCNLAHRRIYSQNFLV